MICRGLPVFAPGVEVLQFDREYGCLQPIKTAVAAFNEVGVFFGLAVIGNDPRLFGELGVAGGHSAGIAIRSEVLAWIEAKCGRMAPSADFLPVDGGAVRWGAILEDKQPMLFCD